MIYVGQLILYTWVRYVYIDTTDLDVHTTDYLGHISGAANPPLNIIYPHVAEFPVPTCLLLRPIYATNLCLYKVIKNTDRAKKATRENYRHD